MPFPRRPPRRSEFGGIMMNIANFPNYFGVQQGRQAAPMDRLVSMLNEKAGEASPLEAARQALLAAKSRLEQHRDEQIEQALDGYLALRSRQTSYEEQLSVQQKQLEDFQSLTSRYDALSSELASTRADCPKPDLAQSLRMSALEDELAAADRGISAMVEQANRYANSQRQYASYLENTAQSRYAAFEYQDQPQYTRESFVSQTSDMIDALETEAGQWQERISSYCEQFGMTPYDFECYLQERNKLADACFAAQQKLSELLRPADGTAPTRNGGKATEFDVKA